MGRKSLKGLPEGLTHFASELSRQNIRYHIGQDCLIIPYLCKGVISQKQEEQIYVTWGKLPANIHLYNKHELLCVTTNYHHEEYYDWHHQAVRAIIRFLNQEQAWQKKGIDTRGA